MHTPNINRYSNMKYNRCGNSGLMLPAISLGLWHNFGSTSPFDNSREMILGAFDMGITHFDLANNYGPEICTAEQTFGKVTECGKVPMANGAVKKHCLQVLTNRSSVWDLIM